MITGFVSMMMVVIEYLNVFSQGIWQHGLRGSRWKQYLLASFLGATPGCLGAFAVVSLYTHREVTLGAVVTAMIATSGDESFVMLSMIPGQAPLVFIVLLFLGLAAGLITDALFSRTTGEKPLCSHEFETHQPETCSCFPWGKLREQWLHCSPARAGRITKRFHKSQDHQPFCRLIAGNDGIFYRMVIHLHTRSFSFL
jgi:hypothetical protein